MRCEQPECDCCKEASALMARNAELESAIRDTPVLVLDVKACAVRGEEAAIQYARDLVVWKARIDQLLGRT